MGSSTAKIVYQSDWATYEDSYEIFIIEINYNRFFYIDKSVNPYTNGPSYSRGFLSLAESLRLIDEVEEQIYQLDKELTCQ